MADGDQMSTKQARSLLLDKYMNYFKRSESIEDILGEASKESNTDLCNKVLYDIANKYSEGNGITKDFERAVQLYKWLVERSMEKALYQLGHVYYDEEYREYDLLKAVDYFQAYYDYISENHKSKTFIHEVTFNLAEALLQLTKYSEALKFAFQCYQDDEMEEDDEEDVLKIILRCYLMVDEHDPNRFKLLYLPRKSLETILNSSKDLASKEGESCVYYTRLMVIFMKYPATDSINKNISKLWKKCAQNIITRALNKSSQKISIDHQNNTNLYLYKTGSSVIRNDQALLEGICRRNKDSEYLSTHLRHVEFLRRVELLRQYYVQRRFFDPSHPQNRECERSLTSLLKRRYWGSTDAADFSGISVKHIIVAERAAMETSLDLFGGFPLMCENRDELRVVSKDRTPLGWVTTAETIMLDNIQIRYKHQSDLYANHIGNYVLQDVGQAKYEDILKFFQDLVTNRSNPVTTIENEKYLATLMLNYAKTGTINLQDLEDKISRPLTDEEKKKLYTFVYHIMVKEVVRRIVCKNPVCEIPVAIVQARAIRLVKEGYLRLKDVFGKDCDYGVVTGDYIHVNHDAVMEKFYRINAKYQELYKKEMSEALSDTNINHPDIILVTSCKKLYTELIEIYGGAVTDDESRAYEDLDKRIDYMIIHFN